MTQTHRPTTADVIAWFKDERSRREAAEARIAALEADLRAAVAALDDIYQCPQAEACPRCWMTLVSVMSRPGVAALGEYSHDG